MKTKYFLYFLPVMLLFFGSCLDDLNVKPLDPNSGTVDQVYSDDASYLKGLMKIYSTYAMSGQNGEGDSDITGMDGGNTQLLRSWWILQEVTTDECINAWADDAWTTEINGMLWTNAKNESIEGVYQRCMFTIALVNEYLMQTSEGQVRDRGGNDKTVSDVNGYRNEARFIRALSYYILMDAFGRPPFITEENYSLTPAQIERGDLFNWIEGELKDLGQGKMLPESRTAYGRADKGAVNALLSRMYLNAKVFTGTDRFTDCITASKAVIDAGYALADKYSNLFKADNNVTCSNEIIFPICFDGAATKTWGGMTFLLCASRGANNTLLERDGLIAGGWDGNRPRPELVRKFEFSNPNYADDADAGSILDKRGIFDAPSIKDDNGVEKKRPFEIESWAKTFASQGWECYKYANITSDNALGSDGQFPDIDFPFFRLGEIYLNYAEAVVRGGQGGSMNLAVGYVNQLRERGYENSSRNIGESDLTPEFILNERARELYWEGMRRTDLVRYGLYTSANYLWTFKGGVQAGRGVASYKNIFPIPLSDLSVNPSLTQNEGYH